MGLIASLMSDLFSRSFRSQANLEDRVEITAMKRMIVERFACAQTLDSPENSDLPLNCSAFSNKLARDRFGVPIVFPGWRVGARCRNNEMIMRLVPTDGQINRLTKQAYSGSIVNRIFEGLGFCAEYFTPRPSNVPPRSFGGTFQLRLDFKADPTNDCRNRNIYTNSCSCPPGFFETQFFDFYTGNTEEQCNRWYGDDLGASTQRCGVASYMCMPFE